MSCQSKLFACLLSLCVLPALADSESEPPIIELAVGEDAPDMDASLRAHLSLARLTCQTPDWRVRTAVRRAPSELKQGLQAFGYYQPKIDSRFTPGEPCWTARFEIDPGPVVRLRRVDIDIVGEGATDSELTQWVATTPLVADAPLRHRQYEAFKRGFGQRATTLGYLDQGWQQRQLLVDPEQGHADVILVLDTGPRYRIGDVRISETFLDGTLVDGFNPLESGQPLSAPVLIEADRRLSESGYFADVDVRPLLDEKRGRDVPVRVDLRARKRHSYRFGAGIDSDTGPRVTAAYSNRYVTSEGHRFFGELSLSTELSSLQSKYEIPLLRDPANRVIAFSGALFRERTDVVSSDRMDLVASYRYPRGDWREEPFVKLLAERSAAGSEEPRDGRLLLIPGIRWDTSFFDDPIDTRHAHRLGFELQGAHAALGSDASFVQGGVNAGLVRSRPQSLRLIARAELGVTIGDTGLELPTSLRYFAGGDRSVRGYGYQRLAPRDDSGEPRGGGYLATFSVEADYPVWGNWYGAVFADAGNAADSLDNAFDVETAYGVGVRWLTPVGRIRVDLAIPQNRFEDDYRIHFGLGADL